MNFQPKLESWDCYEERLEHHFNVSGIDSDVKKTSMLIQLNGPSTYSLLKDLCFPKNPSDLTYLEILEILRKHFHGAVNVYSERKRFYAARKNPKEAVSTWHQRIRGLALNCRFGSMTENILRDKFVTGFEGTIFQRLSEEDENVSLAAALELALRYELDSTEPVNKTKYIAAEQKNKNKQHQPAMVRNNFVERETRTPNQNASQSSSISIVCYRCGKKGHYANNCYANIPKNPHSIANKRGENDGDCIIS